MNIKLWVVINGNEEVFGPFDSESQAIEYAKSKGWTKRYMTRPIQAAF